MTQDEILEAIMVRLGKLKPKLEQLSEELSEEMIKTGKCVHGVPIFDKEGNLTRCEKCHQFAMLAMNSESVDKFMTKEEQKQYGIASEGGENEA